ncbi:hypothetical protein PF002_g17296 [Phytophthora fragariae]|uniref:Uncharacterized protein n=1 Tax=Phytophthora fragariae TaxID=53985 RepID=A0A6A3YC30_9STRA|nr:hypothetical protein PF002_g17296 [Phytophthora fragariae]
MAFLAEDEDAMCAFEAALSFVDSFSVHENVPEFAALAETIAAPSPVANGLEMPAPNDESDAHSAGTEDSAVNATSQGPRHTSVLSNSSRASGTAARPISEVVKARRRAADNARKRELRKAGIYSDPNRARNERKLEIAYLREKRIETGAKRVGTRGRREKAERENVRLKIVLEGQIKVAKSLESLLLKRAQQQIAECSSSIRRPGDIMCPSGRTLDFRLRKTSWKSIRESSTESRHAVHDH